MITKEALEEAIVDIAAEQPEMHFKDILGCKYYDTDTGAPCCIVGHALDRLGFPKGLVLNAGRNNDRYVSVARNYEDMLPYSSFVAKVQQLQDSGTKWGQAVEEAKEWRRAVFGS